MGVGWWSAPWTSNLRNLRNLFCFSMVSALSCQESQESHLFFNAFWFAGWFSLVFLRFYKVLDAKCCISLGFERICLEKYGFP